MTDISVCPGHRIDGWNTEIYTGTDISDFWIFAIGRSYRYAEVSGLVISIYRGNAANLSISLFELGLLEDRSLADDATLPTPAFFANFSEILRFFTSELF